MYLTWYESSTLKPCRKMALKMRASNHMVLVQNLLNICQEWTKSKYFCLSWKKAWCYDTSPWWCHQMEIFSALLVICEGNSPVPGEFPAQRPVTRSFDVFFDLRLNKRLSKQSWGWWFETLPHPLWCYSNAISLTHWSLDKLLTFSILTIFYILDMSMNTTHWYAIP